MITRTGYSRYEKNDRIRDFIEVKDIFEGGLGRVYIGFCHKRMKKIVVKTIKEVIWDRYKLFESWEFLKDSIIENAIDDTKIVQLGDYILLALFREARLSCQLTGHMNLVSGLDFWWTESGQIFFECEYIENSIDLEKKYQDIFGKTGKSTIGILQSLHIAISFANAFIYINDEIIKAYNRSIASSTQRAISFVHRDIKPENILITGKNIPKIIDLGLSKFILAGGSYSNFMATPPKAGTFDYMSPEQKIHFDNVIPSSDIYSFGATLYRMLGGNLGNLNHRMNEKDIEPVQGIPDEYMQILNKCLQVSPHNRYQNFNELKKELVHLIISIAKGKVKIAENLRCKMCGCVHNTKGRKSALELSKSKSKNDHHFVLIPSGEFYKGCKKEHAEQLVGKFSQYISKSGFKEQYEKVYLNEFEIDIYPVTNMQYLNFVKSTGYSPIPDHWNRDLNNAFEESIANHPVVNVSYDDAQAYCNWLGYRLPTGEEWEKSARGTSGNLYPWGDVYSSAYCNSAESGHRNTVAVAEYENGRSPYGCHHMVGNVSEWVNESHPENESYKYLRGGCWGDSCELFGLPFVHDLAVNSNQKHNTFGFRVAREPDRKSSIGSTEIVQEDERCPVCNGELESFDVSDLKIPENNVYTWIGFFDTNSV